jgi:anti-anti-sigma factor
MEIKQQRIEGFLEVHAVGRLDAYWSDHLSQALEEMIRQGDDRIRLNLQGVDYISSMGLRVLVNFYKKLASINGALVVAEPSDAVSKVLDMVGLKATLMAGAQGRDTEVFEQVALIERETGRMDVYPLRGEPVMHCQLVGNPSLLETCRYTAGDAQSVSFPAGTYGIGLGAFGETFEECSSRFGEFLAVQGAAAYQPSDQSNAPDYMLAQGALVPRLQALYGLILSGGFQRLGRFRTHRDARGVALSVLAEMALDASESEQAAFVMIGESAGLVGASLRRSPVGVNQAEGMFAHPEIRKWLSFTTERAFGRALTVSVGVLARNPEANLAAFLRPLNGAGSVFGHVHTAAFPYRPLQKGRIELDKTIRSLFEHETLLGMLHLLGDDRGSSGVAESEFVRGACWIAPLASIRQ